MERQIDTEPNIDQDNFSCRFLLCYSNISETENHLSPFEEEKQEEESKSGNCVRLHKVIVSDTK